MTTPSPNNANTAPSAFATGSSPDPSKVVAYLMSRFPKISETFILYEILELERLGFRVEIFPLVHHHEPAMHPEAQALVDRAHYPALFSRQTLAAQLYWLRKRPLAYLRAWARALAGNASSRKFLIRALAVVPEAALFARQIEQLGVQHVHAHWATHPTLAAYTIHILTGRPYSFTAHAHDIYVERPMLDEKIRHASFVVTISEYNRRLLGEFYGSQAAEKTVVIHCGIDPLIFEPRPARQPGGPFKMICVASLQDYKGHPYLIEACAQLKAQGLNIRCLLVGEGEDRPQIEAQIARLGLENQVILLGHQPRNRVSELIASADVMVLPSVTTSSGKKEGIPVALMEALATEVPVVATDISGIPELIDDQRTGLLVPQRDVPALVEALRRLYHDPKLGAQLGAAGRVKVLREFNLRQTTAALAQLLLRDWSADTLVSHPTLAAPAPPEGS